MNTSLRTFLESLFPMRAALFLLACMLGAPLPARAGEDAADAAAKPRPQLSDKIAADVGKVQPLLDAKNWDEAANLLTATLARTEAGSYDQVVVGGLLAQVYLQRGTKADYSAAIPLLARTVETDFYDAQRRADVMFLIAQLYLQDNNSAKAEEFAAGYLATAPKPQVERMVFHASLMLMRAQKENPMDQALANQVLEEVNRAFLLAYKPTEQLLVLKAVALQGLERYDEGAEVLELLVKLFPESKQYWPQLFSLYVNNQRVLRAILTLERAQERGLMSTPKENLALISLYYNMENYPKAIALLEKGLRDGTVESDPQNWELLAFAYQRTNRMEKSIEVYKEAAKHFKSGKFDAQIANIMFNQGNMPTAFAHAKLALEKGGIDRPEQLGTFAAFLGYELKRYQEALEILDRIEPNVRGERERDEYRRLRKAVEDAIQPPSEKRA